MQIQESAISCGIAQLHDLNDCFNKKNAKEQMNKWSQDRWANFFIACVIPTQRKAIRTLRALGFKRIASFTNKNTGNKNTLYMKNLRSKK